MMRLPNEIKAENVCAHEYPFYNILVHPERVGIVLESHKPFPV